MKISQIMTRDIEVVGADESLMAVRKLFASRAFHHLMVVERGQICGVVSDRDLLKALSPFIGSHNEHIRDTETLNQKVHRIMSSDPITLGEEASVMDALRLFDKHPISCIPIVDGDNRPVGIVSWRDIFRAVLMRQGGAESP